MNFSICDIVVGFPKYSYIKEMFYGISRQHTIKLMPFKFEYCNTSSIMLPCGLKASVQVDLAIYRSMLNESLSE